MVKDFSNVLLASDLDGTLLNSMHQISKRNLKAIQKFEALGGRFTIASGRGTVSARPYAEQLKLQYPAIIFNGCMIYDFQKNKILWQKKLPVESARNIGDVINAFPDAGVQCLTANHFYVLKNTPLMKRNLEIEKIKTISCTIDTMPENMIKMLFVIDQNRMPAFREFLKSKIKGGVHFVQSSPFYLEMLPEKTSKATGLRNLIGQMDIELKDTIAIGDYYNDIEMVQEAGLGVAAGNAAEPVKTIADMIVQTNDHHAVADLIDHLLRC